MNDLERAKSIIQRALKSNKLLTEFSSWDNLDYQIREEAMNQMKCAVCRKVKLLTGTYHHIFATEPACRDCSDQVQYPHLFQGARA